jgi:hypothetical protein
MAKLIYTAITSLDGYVADANGNFDWAAPDDDVHAFVNELERPIGTYLDGRRLYASATSSQADRATRRRRRSSSAVRVLDVELDHRFERRCCST